MVAVVSLELPAGAMEPTDADPVFAAARELREKTDYQALVWRYAGRLAPKPASHDNLCHVVVAPDVHFQQAAMDEPFKRVRVVRMPVSEVLDLTMRGGNVQAMHVASLLVGVSAAGRLNCAVLRPRQRRVQF